MVFAKKSLGQNFLIDKDVLKKIVDAAELSESDNVLEIGPGKGILTNELVKKAGKIIAIEKDEELSRLMDSRLRGNDKGVVISGDILKINLPKLIEENNFQDYKVVANIPYYITGKLFKLLLETKYSPRSMTLLVQKEVAERICAKLGSMSILAISVQYYGSSSIKGLVSRESFSPIPKVDSAILRIDLLDEKYLENKKQKKEDFFRLVKVGFSSPRKTLANNLSNGLGLDKNLIEQLFKKEKFNSAIRAQSLSVEDWERLLTALNNLKNKCE